jgi:hypothetical protein
MYAVEFEVDVNNPSSLLKNFEPFANQHIKVIVLAQDAPKTSKRSVDIDYLKDLRARHFKPTTSMDVDAIMQDMNHGLS